MSLFIKFCSGFPYSYRRNSLSSFSAPIKFQLNLHSRSPYNGTINQICCSSILADESVDKKAENGKISSGFVLFENVVKHRRRQANRSILVQVQSEQSCPELYDYCNSIAPVNTLYHYSLQENTHCVLLEFKDNCIEDVYKKCAHMDRSQCVPVRSPILWFKANKTRHSNGKSFLSDIPLERHLRPPDNQLLADWLSQAQSVSDGMRILYESVKLDELGTRLRYLTARQVEHSLAGLFPHCEALPFGSTVNGFGKVNCDLDLVLRYDGTREDEESRLIFHCKSSNLGGKIQTQRHMEFIADQIQLFLPGCTGVKRILKARVPIIKYTQEMTGVACDLSLANLSGVYMSELLWLFGELDSRVREIVFTVKRWAQYVGLTNAAPGPWITNFSLTLLVIFHLQTRAVLPSFDRLIALARKEDLRYASDLNCTFLRDISSVKVQKEESSSSDLLLDFFEFYTSFDFSTKGVSVCSGQTIGKPDYSPLYIVNPLERSMNVSKNMSAEEVERLRVELRNAHWTLETSNAFTDLFKATNIYPRRIINTNRTPRMVAVKDLFPPR